MKKQIRKLNIHKRTISNLNDLEMYVIAGGNSNGNGCYTNHGCGGGTIASNYTCITCKVKTCNKHCGY